MENHKLLTGILRDAQHLPANDNTRFKLAARIDALPSISSPNGASAVGAAATVTPAVTCLDPSVRFPVINGREQVRDLLRALKLANGGLKRQVKGLISLIGQFGIEDALMIDVLADEIAESIPASLPEEDSGPSHGEGTDLPCFDEAERVATTKSQSVRYRNRHNRMTDRLKGLFCKYVLNVVTMS
jgi:hypothetical protein